MKKIKSGFTLAEVLITLAIIGIVAAIVMPSVIASYQLKTVGVKLAKFAGTIESSARAYTASNGVFAIMTAANEGNATAVATVNDFLRDSLVLKTINAPAENMRFGQNQYDGLMLGVRDAQAESIGVARAGDEAQGGNQVNGQIGVLKDNTRVLIYPLSADPDAANWAPADGQNINTANVGEGAFIIAFDPAVNGLPARVQKIYNFVVTESGFIFPAHTDTCLWAIYNNDWNSTSALMEQNNCTRAQ